MNRANKIFFTSHEVKKLLKVSSCHLMHMRTSGELKCTKLGNAFLYQLPINFTLLNHPLGIQLIDWYKSRHPLDINNSPQSAETIKALELLVAEVLIPVERKFGALQITYGFTSAELAKHIAKNSPHGTAPKLDQHAACEVNSKNNPYCKRYGAACDFIISDYKNNMNLVSDWMNENLNFDRMYFYGSDRPIHISVGPDNSKFIQIMGSSLGGKRVPKKNGTKVKFSDLWEE